MSKTFREWTLDQALLLPPSVHDFVPAGHLSRFVVALVTEELDLSAILTSRLPNFKQKSSNSLAYGHRTLKCRA
jgi:hypothetical protein